jgi:ABC-2 type transport system ATP-binding protein
VVAKERIRQFIKAINRERGTTVVLTTHDLGDVEKLCERVIMINQGRLMFDGPLAELRTRYGGGRVVIADFEGPPGQVAVPGARLLRVEENRAWLSVEHANEGESGGAGSGSMAGVMSALFRDYHVRDVSIQEPEIEEIVRKLYESYPTR